MSPEDVWIDLLDIVREYRNNFPIQKHLWDRKLFDVSSWNEFGMG